MTARHGNTGEHVHMMGDRYEMVLRTPCLVFDELGADEVAMVEYYLARGEAFRVVIGRS